MSQEVHEVREVQETQAVPAESKLDGDNSCRCSQENLGDDCIEDESKPLYSVDVHQSRNDYDIKPTPTPRMYRII
jgi:hypothetical protein